MNLRTIEWAAFIKGSSTRGASRPASWPDHPPDPDLHSVWHSDNAKPGGLNFTGYQNPELDELLVRARETFDRAARKKLLDRAQEIIASDQPYSFLYAPDALPMVNSRVRGIEPAPAGIGHNFSEWWIPQDRQAARLLP